MPPTGSCRGRRDEQDRPGRDSRLYVRGAKPRPARARRPGGRQLGLPEGQQGQGQPLRRAHPHRRRPFRRIRHPLGGHSVRDGPEHHARPASARPRSREPRADLRRSQARAARLRPHGPWPARHRAVGPRRQEVRRAGRASAGRFSYPPADLCQHLSRPGRAGRPGQPGGVRRLRRSLQRARLHGLQDPRLARRRPPARGEEPARRARARRRRHGADDRSGVRAAHLHGRPLRRPRVRRGAVLLVRGPVPRRRGLRLWPQEVAREAEDAAS